MQSNGRLVGLKTTQLFFAAVFSLLAFFPGLVIADSHAASAASRDTDTILVTANRIPTERARVGTTTYVIDAEQIEKRQYRFVLDALRSVPGVRVSQNGGLGATALVRLRGAATGQTLVRVDGIVVNDPTSGSGEFNFGSLDTSDIESIEVSSGAQSTIHGSAAIGGVINITTKSGASAGPLTGYVEGGSYSTFRGLLETGNKTESYSYRLSANYVDSNGFSKDDENDLANPEDDAYKSLTLSGNLVLTPVGWLTTGLTARFNDADTDFDNCCPSDAPNVIARAEQLWLGGFISATAFEGRVTNSFRIDYADSDLENVDTGVPTYQAEGDRLTFEYQLTQKLSDDYTLLLGAEHEQQAVKFPLDFDPALTQSQEITSTGMFALLQAAPLDGLTLTAGARLDDYDGGEDGNGNSFADFSSEATTQFTGAWNLPDDNTTVRASWGQGFKAPTIYELTASFDPMFPATGELDPETSDSWDIGIEHTFAALETTVQVTYFRDDAKNLIVYDFPTSRFANVASARRKGVEFTASSQVSDGVTVALSGAYIDAYDKSTGRALPRVPDWSGYANVTWRPTRGSSFFANLALTRNAFNSDFDVEKEPGYGVVDMGGTLTINEQVSVLARVENVFDNEYQEVRGYGTSDRALYLGVKLRL